MSTVYSSPFSTKPVWVSETASVASADYAPTGGQFRALNCSTAGLLKMVKGDGSTVVEYLNTGWNPTSGTLVKTDNANTAVLAAAAIDR